MLGCFPPECVAMVMATARQASPSDEYLIQTSLVWSETAARAKSPSRPSGFRVVFGGLKKCASGELSWSNFRWMLFHHAAPVCEVLQQYYHFTSHPVKVLGNLGLLFNLICVSLILFSFWNQLSKPLLVHWMFLFHLRLNTHHAFKWQEEGRRCEQESCLLLPVCVGGYKKWWPFYTSTTLSFLLL